MIGGVTFGVIGLLFLFADIRTFSSTFQQTFFGAPNTNLGIMATSVFATSLLALVVSWRLGPARALGASAAVFALATFLCTASRNNWVDLALSVVALASGFWWLAFLQSARAGEGVSAVARALPLAFAGDLALRAVFRTVAVPDLAWPVAAGIGLAAALVFGASGLATLAPARQWTAPDLRGLAGLLVVPCLFLVAETGATNGAQAALASGLGLGPEEPRATQVGQLALGIGLAVGALAQWRFAPRPWAGAVAVATGAALLWAHIPFVSLAGAALLAAGAVLVAGALLGGPVHPARGPAATVLALSLGWILFAGTAFGFYAFWAYLPAVWVATGLVALGALASSAGRVRPRFALAVATAALAIGGPAAAYVGTTPLDAPLPDKLTFRVMTYNIHQGFNAGQIPSFDALVDVIAQESPDVLCLQEVVRGWMIDEQHDALAILSERLGMRYAWLPAIGDLYGDAILSRFEMTDARRVAYAREPSVKHQPRGAISVKTSGVTVVCTHLDEVGDASIVRQEQVRTIIREWGDVTPVLVMGDLNATPDEIEIRIFNEAGFDDLGAPAGDTTTMSDPQKRIDYVLGKGVIGAQAHIAANNDLKRLMEASDHRSVVVNVTVQK